jgi:Ca2+-binding EF-hand superfamily protein
MFDQEKSGEVDTQHLKTILKCLGRDPAESDELLQSFNPGQDRLTFAEFLLIMKNLENRLVLG